MKQNGLFSADSHIVEPPDLWTTRLPKKFRHRGLRVVRRGNKETWLAERNLVISTAIAGSQAGKRRTNVDAIKFEGLFNEDVRKGGYDPVARLDDMKLDGVVAEVLYPTVGLHLCGKIQDTALQTAIFQAANDWMAEFCSADFRRFKGCAMVNLDNLSSAISELRRVAANRLAGALISVYPQPSRRFDRPVMESFWNAAEECGLPLTLHVTSNREQYPIPPENGSAERFFSTSDYWVRRSLADMIFSGVFERHPKLRIVSVEHEMAWAPHFLQAMDFVYKRFPRGARSKYRFKNQALPSDFFHKNVSVTFIEDPAGIAMRHLIGVDNIMWSSDYPHSESSWPHSREVLKQDLRGVRADEMLKITYGNAAKLYP